MSAIVPVPRVPIAIRPATMSDLPFIDRLQKMHSKMVGWMPTKQLEGKIGAGNVIVAVDEASQTVGYCIGQDQYFKRDDVGIIYQMNVVPDRQRSLIGAMLVKAMFERAAYGCRLFCCWCAQDIEANYFWESLGFVPLAFRAGSRDKGRVHIFWQRRIREGDESTPYWFPAQTTSGSIREDRLVLPIPPGVHWNSEMPRIIPSGTGSQPVLEEKHALKTRAAEMPKPPKPKRLYMHFDAPPPPAPPPEPVVEKPKRAKKPKVKNDPALVAKARELRDRWLEKVNGPGGAALLASQSKYELSAPPPASPALPAPPEAIAA